MKRTVMAAALAAALMTGAAHTAVAAEEGAPAKKAQQREPIYGYRMMTDAERNEYRQKMREAKTLEERRALRDEHRTLMESRMKERGIEPGQRGPRGPGAGRGDGPRGPGAGGPRGPGGDGPGRGFGKGPGAGGPGKGYGPGPGGPGGRGQGYGPGAGSTAPQN